MKICLHSSVFRKQVVVLAGLILIPVLIFSQSFHGISSSIVDNIAGGEAGPTVTIVPPTVPTAMNAGDLVIVYVQYRNNSAVTVTTGNAGGQTWNIGATSNSGTSHYLAILWCQFNGTWSANPTFTITTGANAMTAVMYVFRPSSASSKWGVHQVQANASGNGTTQTIGAITTQVPKTVTMAFWGNTSLNTWTGVLSSGWTRPAFPLSANQIRNDNLLSSTRLSHTAAYNIQPTAATLNAVSQDQSLNTNTGRSSMVWFELTNDECSNAINLTPNASCINTVGSLSGATASSGIPAGCATGTLYDLWYSFTATSNRHDISMSLASNFNSRRIEVYQGSCSGLSFVTCSPVFATSSTLTFHDYSPGMVYYVRVIGTTQYTSTADFNICVTTTAMAASPPPVFTGKSYTNISRPTGGIIANGDILEFRYNITVGDWNASQPAIYNARFLDTIPSGLSYVANSIRFETNEGFTVQSAITGSTSLTDASGDDEAVYSGGVLRVNAGTLNRLGSGGATTRQFTTNISAATIPITDNAAGGGKMSKYGRPNQFGGFVVLVIRYQVQVTEVTGNTFQTSYGKFMYQTGTADISGAQTTINFPRYSAHVSADAALCQSTVGINVYSNGDFGSGTTRHDSSLAAMTSAPGYTWSPFTNGSPGDGLFAVVNNTSENGSTNKYAAIPDATNRIFDVWDIIGDHTNATNLDSGNFAVAPGTNGGYMAVVNAAYGINNAVQRTINGLCSDTYYEFSAWFKNICQACSSDSSGRTSSSGASFKPYIPIASRVLNDSAGVSPDLTYTIDGVDYYTTGGIPYDKRWVKKGFLFRTGPSQTSVTLTIRNNAPGGGGNDWAIDDIGLATCLPTLGMRPSNTPTYCRNAQINLSVIVTTFYSNYTLYQWERDINDGNGWQPIGGPQTYSYTFNGTNYNDTVALPSFLATATMNGHRYRIKTATSLGNLSSSSCAVYNSVDIITITVNPTCDVLPAELLSFNAQLKNGHTELKWSTKQEQTLQQYDVERSVDGRNFVKIGTVAARGGTGEENYLFTDIDAATGKLYYRIRLVAQQGSTYKLSNIVSITTLPVNSFEVSSLVNPFHTKINFQLTVPQNQVADIQLLDASGKQVYQKKMSVNKGSNAINFETPANLQSGNYLLRIVVQQGVVHKLVKKQ
jgi:trimeric autotransporter adhesin